MENEIQPNILRVQPTIYTSPLLDAEKPKRKSKLIIVAIFLLVLFFIGIIGYFLYKNYISKNQKTVESPTSVLPIGPKNVPITKNSENIRLATNIQNSSVIDILNKYAKANDVIEVRAGELDKLGSIKTGTPLLIYGKNDNQVESFNLAKKYGIMIIGYNLEDSKITSEELIEKEKAAYTLAKENGLFYIFCPLAIHAEKYGADLAKNADAVVIQLRNYQLMENFADKVKEMAANMRSANPNVEVWVQLDVNPRAPGNLNERQSLNSEEMLQQIKLIENDVDLIAIYYPPKEALVVSEVFTLLRK